MPKSDVPGEESLADAAVPDAAPPPYARLKFGVEDINPYLDEAERRGCAAICRNARNEGLFTPQTLTRDQISIPASSADRTGRGSGGRSDDRHALRAIADQPAIHKLREYKAEATPPQGPPRPPMPDIAGVTRYTARLGAMWRTNNGLPAISPPWAELVAYDLNEGTIRWRAPLGSVRALAAKGITNTGNAQRIHRNGPVVTAGGLIFIGTNADGYVRAFDKDTGKMLWERHSTPIPKAWPRSTKSAGRQYVAFCASYYPEVDPGNIAIFPGKRRRRATTSSRCRRSVRRAMNGSIGGSKAR